MSKLESKVEQLKLLVSSINGVLYRVQDAITDEEFQEARAELAELDNEINRAMGLIDELMQREPTREEWES